MRVLDGLDLALILKKIILQTGLIEHVSIKIDGNDTHEWLTFKWAYTGKEPDWETACQKILTINEVFE